MKRLLCMTVVGAICVGLAVPVALAAQAGGPGYVDAQEMGLLPDVVPTVSVSLVKPLLRVAAVASGAVTPEIGELLGTVDHVETRVYDHLQQEADVAGQTTRFVENLVAAGWYPTVRVAEGDERVTVLLKTEGDNIAGLVVLVAGKEVVFVNLCGAIEPERTGELISIIGEKYMNGELLPAQIMAKIAGHKGAAHAPSDAKKAKAVMDHSGHSETSEATLVSPKS